MDSLVLLENCIGCTGIKGVPGRDKAEEGFLMGGRVGGRNRREYYQCLVLLKEQDW